IQQEFSVDVRYRGQGYELNVPYSKALISRFRREHERRYGYSYPAREVELVTLRLRAIVKSPQVKLRGEFVNETQRVVRPQKTPVYFDNKKTLAAIYDRDSLRVGKKYAGPAVITEYSATTVVPPGQKFWLDGARNLVIQIRS